MIFMGRINAQNCINCDNPFPDGDTLYRSKIGFNNTATGQYSFAGGENTFSEGLRSFAFGYNASSTNINSISFGNGATSTGMNAVAIGQSTTSSGNGSFAFGSQTSSTGTGTFALGTRVKTNYALAFAIGSAPGNSVLENDQMETMMIGFNSSKPTLFISRSSNEAYPYDRTGRVAIGNMTDPQAKLHIYSDDDESATLFLQPSNWNSDYKASFWMGNQNNGITADIDKGLLFDSEHDFIFNSGKVGIGADEPSAKLDVNGSARIRDLAGDGERVVVADSAGNLNTTFLSGQCVSCENNTVDFDAFASAIGQNNTATGQASFASGGYSSAIGDLSTAIGAFNLSDGIYSTTLGNYLKANVSHAMVLGDGYGENNELENNHAYSLIIGFKSSRPTLYVGTSPGSDNTGRVAIGDMTDPKAKLHIYSDDDESAVLFLQPSNWTTQYNAEIWMGDTNQRIVADVDKGLLFESENDFAFNGRNLGIGTEQPSAKLEITNGDIYINDLEKGIIMKSPDGKCWRGTLNNSGSLNFVLLESCPDSPSAVPENNDSQSRSGLKVYPNPVQHYLNVEIENHDRSTLKATLSSESGMVVRTSVLTGNKTQFYTGDLKPGVYVVRVSGKSFAKSRKVVIQ